MKFLFTGAKRSSNQSLSLNLKLELDELKEQLVESSGFIKEIEKGNLDTKVSDKLQNSEIGGALISMQLHLAKIAAEERERTWANAGLAKFSDILRNKASLSLKELANDILMNLVKYVHANQGAIYILEDAVQGDEHLEIIACYAYERRKYLDKRIGIGEGLAGQCVLEREAIYLTNVPNNYVNITSGLGDATPRAILIAPLMINEKVFGVTELASFEEFEPYKIDFINKLSENIASSIKNVKDSEKTQALLMASQQQAEELRAQEEEMRQNMEEMEATQEEMARKNEDIARAAVESDGILKGINATMATIEFTPEGTVITANANFLAAVKYSLAEVTGKHHRIFVPKEIAESDDYASFWTRLASGIPASGVFKRINSKGETVWLNAIYNPIYDVSGNVSKVVKFATDITAEQELLAESKGIHNGINSTMATIEFTTTGTVLTANDNFLHTMKYSLLEIKGKHHKTFVPKEIQETDDYKAFWTRLASGESISDVFKRINSKGETVWLKAIYNPLTDASGKVVKVVKFATDITSEQELLAENKGVLNGINATMATIEFTPQGIVLDANDNFLKTMQYSLDQIKGKSHRTFVPKEILETEEYKTFWTKLASGESHSGVFKRINSKGGNVWLNAIYTPISNTNGEVFKVVKFASDITREKEKEIEIQQLLEESKAQEEEIRQNLEEMQATQEEIARKQEEANDILEIFNLVTRTSTEGLWNMVVPASMEFTDNTPFNWSDRFRTMLGYENEQDFPDVLHSWSDLLHPDHKQDTLNAFSAHLMDLSGKTPYDVQYQLKLKNGTYRWFRAVGNTLRDEYGKPKRVAGSLIDIQAIKDLESGNVKKK